MVFKSDFPSDVLKWMKANAAPKMGLKLMEVCKYFQHKNFPYFVVKKFLISDWRWECTNLLNIEDDCKDFEKIPNNLWITENLVIIKNFVSLLLPKISVLDVYNIEFFNQKILFNEFKILIAKNKIKEILLSRTYVYKDDETNLSLEEILEFFPYIEKFQLDDNASPIRSLEAFKCLPFTKLKCIKLQNLFNDINFEAFFAFMHENQRIAYEIFIWTWPRPAYLSTLQLLVDKMIDSWSLDNEPPKITFVDQTKESRIALKRFQEKFLERKNKNNA